MVARTDIDFAALDGTRIRGWLFTPDSVVGRAPAITMAHGFGATRRRGGLENLARMFAEAGYVVVFHDHRSFGDSDGLPRQDIDPWKQIEDWRPAITYLEHLEIVDPSRIGLWGTSFAGGHALVLGATDRRLRAIVAQVPTIDGFDTGHRRVPPQQVAELERSFDEDLRAQFAGEPPATSALVSSDPDTPAAYRSQDAIDFNSREGETGWKNEVTIMSTRRARMYAPGVWAPRVSPTPLLMIVADDDTTAPTDLTLGAYEQAHEPKALKLFHGGHYSAYLDQFEVTSRAAVDWFDTHL